MTPNIALELTIEQLINALNEKLFTECTKIKSTNPPVSRARVATLAAEVNALEKRAKDVLHKVICLRNPLQPVNRLPPELIVLCATFVSCTDPGPIVTLTHVCRYWRRSIASSHGNWTSIGSTWKRLVPLCLERAGVAPLAVKISGPDIRGDEGFLQALLPHVSRISDLSLTGYSSKKGVLDELPGFFASPMPHLTSLELKQTKQPAELFPPDETTTPPIFQNVSKFKSLHLTLIPLYPTLFNIPSLVELELVDYTIPFGKFIGFLESNIDLETITLRLDFVKGSVITAPERMVSLPRLRHLALTFGEENGIGARGLFSCLSLPRSVRVELHVEPEPDSDADIFLASFLPHPPTPVHDLLARVTTIKYQVDPRELHLSGNVGSFSFHTPITSEEIYDEFSLFSTSAVREFHVRPDGWFDHENLVGDLPQALERLPMLEVLALSRASLLPGSLSALSTEPLLCKSLNTIAFLDCQVTQDVITELEEIATKREHSTLARLHRVVIVNDSYELPDTNSIKKLRRLVPRVDAMVGDELPDLL